MHGQTAALGMIGYGKEVTSCKTWQIKYILKLNMYGFKNPNALLVHA